MAPIIPKKTVTINWEILPIKVIITETQRLAFSIASILPANSPVLLGVKRLTVIPAQIALKAFRKDKISILAIKNRHLKASKPQLIIISNSIIGKSLTNELLFTKTSIKE